MRLLTGIGRFVYDFVIGDDWKVAGAVLTALLAGLALLLGGFPPGATTVICAMLVGAGFTVAIVVDVRRTGPGR